MPCSFNDFVEGNEQVLSVYSDDRAIQPFLHRCRLVEALCVQHLVIQCGHRRMHDHFGYRLAEVIDPEIFNVVIAQGTDGIHCCLLCLIRLELAVFGLLFEMGDRGMRCFDQIAQFFLPVED